MPTDLFKIAIRGSTQEHLPIEDIVNDLVLLKDGSCAIVLRLSSVNFDLLSEREQSALVYAYGGILNSLNFPIQIVINSTTKDVSKYLVRLREAEEKQNNELLKIRIQSYRKFIEEIVKKNDVLSKTFYVVIPFSSLELGIKSVSKQMFPMPFAKGNKQAGLPMEKSYILEKARASLEPKKEHLIRLFSRLGLDIRPLDSKELIELFYRTYNEDTALSQKVENTSYTSPVVTVKK